jgi:hypothetical protein
LGLWGGGAGGGPRRLVRRGAAIRTDTYLVDEHMIWGATARIVSDLLDRVGVALDGSRADDASAA